MDNCHLKVVFLAVALLPLRGASLSYIKLEGFKTIRNSAPVYQLICASNKDFLGCTVEFLLNGITQENIRYANNTCYKGNGVCNPFQCACFDGCKNLTWYYTQHKDIENQLFECDARIKDNHVFYQVIASGSFKGGDFFNGETIIKRISGNPSPSQKAPMYTDSIDGTFRKEENISNYNLWLLIINTVFTCLILIIICIGLCMSRKWIWRKMRKKKKTLYVAKR
ncbi:uncharacterized protein LOC127707395 [Mytilus californianus]|uniref:uncharacterized protein LOC127707395 n=1 Tax=Mytilus californianus TaxID=6549 RepID=UPI00224722AD|nr:uncharacterized protein LOC127707395 [Mytilus californianus]